MKRHGGLKFGRLCKTPAMQAGLTERPLTFRDVLGRSASLAFAAAVVRFTTLHDLSKFAATTRVKSTSWAATAELAA